MRLTAVVAIVALSAASSASAQHAYDLDPYKPSEAALLRNYGSVLVALTPIQELRKLDPYVPSQAALLRSLGGAMPLWVGWYPPVPVSPAFGPLTPFPAATVQPPAPAANSAAPRPNVMVIIVSPQGRLSPQGPREERLVPSPQPRQLPIPPSIQVAQRETNASIEVHCDRSDVCRWRVRRADSESDGSDNSACGWMPKGGAVEAGARVPCEDER